MLRARVDLELGDLLPGEPVLRKHALYGGPEHLRRTPAELLAERAAAEAAGIARMAVVPLLVELVARDVDLLCVDDDDEVTGVHVRRVLRLALAAQRVGDTRRQTPERLPIGVDEVSLARDIALLSHMIPIP